jgi:ubiquinone/menaquinone biosynthesis C-methylase UbiE
MTGPHHHHHHHHQGKSSERFLDKEIILKELHLRPGMVIVDAGCGNGYMSKEFSRVLNHTGKVYALDPDGEAIDRLRRETAGTNIEAIQTGITAPTPIEESSVDLIYLATVLHGFSPEEMAGFKEEVKRLLKPQARLAIIEIHKRETPMGPPLDLRYAPEELQRAIGLTPATLVDVGQHFYMQTFVNSG